MRDFLPEDVRKREYVIGVIKEVYERYGFEPLETPAVENIETLTGFSKYSNAGFTKAVAKPISHCAMT
jgi:histidyl-tRNA synthetase